MRMSQTALQKTIHFFLIKIIIGIAVVGGAVALVQWSGDLLLKKTHLNNNAIDVIIAVADCAVGLISYIFLFRIYEKRQIKELSPSSFGSNATAGFITGFILQSLFIFVIYVAGGYSIIKIHPVSSVAPAFAAALTAGFVAEIFIIGIIFRLTEQRSGTAIAVLILTLLFVLLHLNVQGATALSVASTAMQAGFLLSGAYVFTRSLWFVIFLHFAWDLAEPGIFGGVNPGNSIRQSLLESKISGSVFLTGGQQGPQNSIQALLFCLLTGLIFLYLAKRKNNFIKPSWKQ
jgi:CAAX protease family protein